MFTYFKMKRNEWKVKAQFYGMIVKLIDNPKDVMETFEKLIASVPDTPISKNVQTSEETK